GPSNLHVDPVKVRHKVIDSGGQQAFLHVCNCGQPGEHHIAKVRSGGGCPASTCDNYTFPRPDTRPARSGQITEQTAGELRIQSPPPGRPADISTHHLPLHPPWPHYLAAHAHSAGLDIGQTTFGAQTSGAQQAGALLKALQHEPLSTASETPRFFSGGRGDLERGWGRGDDGELRNGNAPRTRLVLTKGEWNSACQQHYLLHTYYTPVYRLTDHQHQTLPQGGIMGRTWRRRNLKSLAVEVERTVYHLQQKEEINGHTGSQNNDLGQKSPEPGNQPDLPKCTVTFGIVLQEATDTLEGRGRHIASHIVICKPLEGPSREP
ncbi:hypothetical protein Bbelb_443070, partial [Branchiostoma belcheri]